MKRLFVLFIIICALSLLEINILAAIDQTQEISTENENLNTVSFMLGSKELIINSVTYTIDATPYCKKACVMVPLKAFIESVNADATTNWNNSDRTLEIRYKEKTIILKVDSNDMYINDNLIKSPVPIEIKKGRMYIPFRVLAEDILGVKANYNKSNKLYTIN